MSKKDANASIEILTKTLDELQERYDTLKSSSRRFMRALNSCWIQGCDDVALKEYLISRVQLFDISFTEH